MSREGLGLPRGIGQRDYGAMASTATTSDGNFGGFSPTEFISLSESIAANTIFVKQSWQFLEKANRTLGTAKDNQSLRDKINDIQTGTNQRITTTTKDLQRLTVVVRGGDKQQKLQVEKLTSDFKQVVQFYSKSQQSIATKMKQVFLVNASQTDDLAMDSAGAGTAGFPGTAEQQQELLKQKQLQQSLQFEQDMLLEREQRFREIESNVLDVNHIMRELSNITTQQSEVIDTIENSIGRTVDNVESGAEELVKAAEYQNRYRRKVLILLIVAVILGLVVTGIIVSKLKS
uniref:t-SNARE coiled-coil homology domain-containing protein n=1 Tax=Anopheles farauti TaxID=69004 RepID=A0A182QP07_9DIPT